MKKIKINKIICGDCIEVLKTLPENSVDSVVTDPPYGLEFMGKEWDKFGISPARAKRLTATDSKGTGDRFFDYRDGAAQRGRYSEMTIKEKSAFQEFIYQWALEVIRVLKPGGHLLAFSGSRTYHRMVVAIEDAGFEIRDMIEWVYGSGFPKSLNIGKAVDKLQGNEREDAGFYESPEHTTGWKGQNKVGSVDFGASGYKDGEKRKLTKGTSEWEGWGTALKPAHEPIVVARKPLSEKSVAENVLRWGTGGMNIDESRVEIQNPQGRFPANLIHDNSDEVRECFPKTISKWGTQSKRHNGDKSMFGLSQENVSLGNEFTGDSGNASRFFKSILYYPKASKSERNMGCEELDDKKYGINITPKEGSIAKYGYEEAKKIMEEKCTNKNNHPTVKPLALMEYLIKMVTPPKGIVLDPFTGSGSTLIAAKDNGFQYIGIEKEEEYIKIAKARLNSIPERLF